MIVEWEMDEKFKSDIFSFFTACFDIRHNLMSVLNLHVLLDTILTME